MRSSPSFLIAVAVSVFVVGGYTAWRVLAPNPHKQSERIVREFGKAASQEAGSARRAMRKAVAVAANKENSVPAALQAIDAELADAGILLDRLAETTRENIEDLENLPLRTLRNRLRRIDRRQAETKELLGEIAQRLKEQLRPSLRPPTPGPAAPGM